MGHLTALVLGGGGSRGLAHIGVLRALEQANVVLDLIVGTSMGAIVGAAYATGKTAADLIVHFRALRQRSPLQMNIFSAKARQRDLERRIRPMFPVSSLEQLKIKTVVMAVDVISGEEIALDSGPLLPAVLASSAVPAVFPPVPIGPYLLADGGVIDSLATHVAVQYGASNIIAVDVYPPLETDQPVWSDPLQAVTGIQLPYFPGLIPESWEKTPGMVSAAWRATRIMTWHLHRLRLQEAPPDVLLRPSVGQISTMDFNNTDAIIEAGYQEAHAHMGDILQLIRG